MGMERICTPEQLAFQIKPFYICATPASTTSADCTATWA